MMARSTEEFAALLSDFSGRADHLWSQYEARGPGAVDSALFAPLADRASRLAELLDGPLPGAVDHAALTR